MNAEITKELSIGQQKIRTKRFNITLFILNYVEKLNITKETFWEQIDKYFDIDKKVTVDDVYRWKNIDKKIYMLIGFNILEKIDDVPYEDEMLRMLVYLYVCSHYENYNVDLCYKELKIYDLVIEYELFLLVLCSMMQK